MNVIDTFGKYIENLCDTNPIKARTLLKTGWQVQKLKLSLMPDTKLLTADRYLAKMMMDTIIKQQTILFMVLTNLWLQRWSPWSSGSAEEKNI